MKIAIPTNGKTIEEGLCVSFGRAPYLFVYNTEGDVKEFIKNPGESSQGGAGIKAAQAVVDTKVDVLVTPRIGQNGADVILASDITMLQSTGNDIMANIQHVLKGELAPLSEIHEGFHNHGARW